MTAAVTSHPKSPRTIGNEAGRNPFSSSEPRGLICDFPYDLTKKRRALGTRMEGTNLVSRVCVALSSGKGQRRGRYFIYDSCSAYQRGPCRSRSPSLTKRIAAPGNEIEKEQKHGGPRRDWFSLFYFGNLQIYRFYVAFQT